MSKRKLLLLGAGGHGKVIAETAELMGMWSHIAFLDDRYPEITASGKWPVVGGFDMANKLQGDFLDAFVSIGDNSLRLCLIEELVRNGFEVPIVIHSSAVVSPTASVGIGTAVLAGVVINASTSVGDACIINSGAIVDHDCILHNGVHLSPGSKLAGSVTVLKCGWIGLGACVLPGRKVGINVMIGAGAVVTKDIPDNTTAFGVPASYRYPSNRDIHA